MSSDSNKNGSRFPKGFLWGASTSAHQVEGGNYNQWTVYELENAKFIAKQAEIDLGVDGGNKDGNKSDITDPYNYISDNLADHYHRYKEDFDLLQDMNMNAFRFSVEWSRIEPKEGAWNAKEIAHYKEYIKELRRRDIEPIMTLFHFTLPIWFVKKGGFQKRANVKYFTRFVEKIVSEIGKDVEYIVTINEPEIYVYQGYFREKWPPLERNILKMWRTYDNLAVAHCRATKAIRKIGGGHKVSISKNSCYFHPGDDAWLSRASASVWQYFHDDYFLNRIIKYCDFLGVNYYFSDRIYGYRIHNLEEKINDLDWDMQPAHVHYVLERLYKKYRVPIIVTENGLADAKDRYRRWWIEQTILGIQKAMRNGVDLRGYLHWSLIDNFEWAHGKWPRFGLAEIDYVTGKRKLRPSARWFGNVIKKIRGASEQ
jgi:beta-glucosidase